MAELCGDDQALRHEVESLLVHAGAASAFLETPAMAEGLAPAVELEERISRGAAVRLVSDSVCLGGWRDGRSLSRPRRALGPRRRDQDPPAPSHRRPRAPRALRAGGADAGGAEPSQHRRHLRPSGRGRRPRARARTGEGRNAGRPSRSGSAPAGRAEGSAGDCAFDCRSPGGRPRARRGSPRFEARQHHDHARRPRKGAGLRARQVQARCCRRVRRIHRRSRERAGLAGPEHSRDARRHHPWHCQGT